MSNHPAPLAGLGDSPPQSVKPTTGARPVASPAKSSPSPARQSAIPTASVVRDDLVRAVMPELRVLMQHLVETAVERAVAPLLEKQRELETALSELRMAQQATRLAQPANFTATRQVANTATQQVTQTLGTARPEAQPVQTPTAPVQPRPIVAQRPAVSAQSTAIDVSFDTSPLEDIPAELNGSRRRRVVFWSFAVFVVLAVLGAIGLSALSHMGTYL